MYELKDYFLLAGFICILRSLEIAASTGVCSALNSDWLRTFLSSFYDWINVISWIYFNACVFFQFQSTFTWLLITQSRQPSIQSQENRFFVLMITSLELLRGELFPKYLFAIHRIHKWRTRGKKLVPSHESEALEGKQKLQTKTFSELAECLARIPPKITLYGLLFKYNYVGCLLLLMFSIDLLFAIKRDTYIFKETGWFCRFPKHQKIDKWAIAGEKRQTCWPKLHIETEFESQLTAIR